MILEPRARDKHQNADSLSKKTELYERQEQWEVNRPEIKDGFSVMDKEKKCTKTYRSRDGSTNQVSRY